MKSLCVVVPSPRDIDRAQKWFPDAHVVSAGHNVCGLGFSVILVMLDPNEDERTKLWLLETMYCRLLPGGRMFRMQHMFPKEEQE